MDYEEYNFEGSIIEAFAQFASVNDGGLELLLKYGTGLFDPSRVLLLFIGAHSHPCGEACLVDLLLEMGADANVTGYQTTPLRIAVVSW